jgi:hypothetical protein
VLATIGAAVLALVISAVWFRLRHREFLFLENWFWIIVAWLVEGLGASAVQLGLFGVGHAAGAANSVLAAPTAIASGALVPFLSTTGIRENASGKRRLTQSNRLVRAIDKLVVDQSRASTAHYCATLSKSFMKLAQPTAQYGHPIFNEYLIFLRQDHATAALLQKVRNTAKDTGGLEERIAAVVALAVEQRHWEFLRGQRRLVARAARRKING